MTNNNGEPPADHPPAAFRSTGRLAAVGLTAVLTLAAVLRIYGLGDEAYWLDEMHSLADSAARRAEFEALRTGVILDAVPRSTDLTPDSTLAAVWRGMEADSHPPLYFEALLLWRRLFGDGEAAVRTLSVIFSLLSLVPVALILRGPHPWLGLAVAAALALSFSHIHIAQENRPYALGLLLISVSYWALVRMQTGWSRWDRNRRQAGALLYGVAIYLSMLTHYFAALALLGQVVLILGLSQRPLRRAWILTVAAATLAFALTWGRQLIGQCEFIAHQPWLLDLHPNHAWATLLRLTDLPLRLLFARERFQLNYYLSFLGAVILIAALFTLWRARRRGALLFAAWYLTPVLGLTLLDLITGKQLLSHIRYAAVAVPGLVGLIVLAADSIGRVAARVIAAAFLAVVLLSHQLPTQENPRARQAAARIAQQLRPGDLLIFDAIGWPDFWPARLYWIVSYYLPDALSKDVPQRTTATPPFAPPPVIVLKDRPDESLRHRMAGFPRWIVVSPRIDGVPNPWPEQYIMAAKTGYLRGVGWIYLFVRAPRDTAPVSVPRP